MVKIYHNSNCSKSRGALAILQDKNLEIEEVHYLEQPPSEESLRRICAMLDRKPVEIIRAKEALFEALGLSLRDKRSDDEWLAILHRHPSLIERPIVIYNNRAVIGRPPERILDILDN